MFLNEWFLVSRFFRGQCFVKNRNSKTEIQKIILLCLILSCLKLSFNQFQSVYVPSSILIGFRFFNIISLKRLRLNVIYLYSYNFLRFNLYYKKDLSVCISSSIVIRGFKLFITTLLNNLSLK